MKVHLKKLSQQVIVITGATSGIGLCTARQAAGSGAKLVLVARNREALHRITEELVAQGASAIYVAADVGDEEQVHNVARTAVSHFGGFDTWINNAGVSIFGRNEQVARNDQRRLFDTNFWGVVYGSLAAAAHLKERGGALINIGSEVSDCAIPLQGMYAASKHAVKGFTDSLRVELEEAGAPVSVTLIKPAAVDTMFVQHAKNYMEVEPKLPAPIYSPDVVADAILFAAQHPRRDIFVGAPARLAAASAHHAPRLTDWIMTRFMFKMQRTQQRVYGRVPSSLHAPVADLQERQGYPGHVCESSLYTKAVTAPRAAWLAVIGTGIGLAAWWQSRRRI